MAYSWLVALSGNLEVVTLSYCPLCWQLGGCLEAATLSYCALCGQRMLLKICPLRTREVDKIYSAL